MSLSTSSVSVILLLYICTCARIHAGLIARFLPVLQATIPDELYDDEPYWEVGQWL